MKLGSPFGEAKLLKSRLFSKQGSVLPPPLKKVPGETFFDSRTGRVPRLKVRKVGTRPPFLVIQLDNCSALAGQFFCAKKDFAGEKFRMASRFV